MKRIGFTNTMAVYILVLLTVCIFMSYDLGVKSVEAEYMGVLACWTACFTPLGLGLDIVLNSVVKKSQAENTAHNGDGIVYRSTIGDCDYTSIGGGDFD